MTTGTLYGVGLGPGDPELITRKAARLIQTAEVIAYHRGPNSVSSNAYVIAAELIPDSALLEELVYPVTTGVTDHPGGYEGALAEFYDHCAARLAAHLDAGHTVVVLCEGDPMFYGSYMYLHDRLAPRFSAEIVPGVTAFSAAAAASGTALVRRTDVLTVLPGTLPEHELARRLADTDAAVIMKLGRTFPAVRGALAQAGRLGDAVYVERASMEAQRIGAAADVDPDQVPYFSVVLAAGDRAHAARGLPPRGAETAEAAASADTGAPAPAGAADRGEVLVVGLGPAGDDWLTPEAGRALARADHLVGYGPYVDKVPVRAGQQRHSSGNTVEVDRARLALDLARGGDTVAVVSGGDAGVFGMASAVFEAAEDPRFADVPIRVLPGLTAAQAVAARAGAPLGGDFAVVNLSDRLKPWELIERRLIALSQADMAVALYNPASRSRTEQIVRAREVLLAARGPDTVVVIGRGVGRDGESTEITTLGALDPATIDMRCLVIVGAQTTAVTAGGQAWTPRFTRG